MGKKFTREQFITALLVVVIIAGFMALTGMQSITNY